MMAIGQCQRWPFLGKLAILIVSALLLACSNFDEPSVNKSLKKPKPSGKIYFRVEGIDTVYYLDADAHEIRSVPLSLKRLWDFDVSANGNWLIIADSCYFDRYNLLKFHRDYHRKPAFLPHGTICVNQDGTVIIYETRYQALPRLAILYIETGDNFLLKSAHGAAAFAPKLAPSGTEYVWTQEDGLYFATLNQTSPLPLSDRVETAEDFSPSGIYIAAGGHIYDLQTKSPYPGKHGGHLRFIDDYSLIRQKPADSDSLEKINISGSYRLFLFRTGRPILNFTVSDGQRFVVAVSGAPDDPNFIFSVYDFIDLEAEFDMPFAKAPHTVIAKLLWPLRPSLAQHD